VDRRLLGRDARVPRLSRGLGRIQSTVSLPPQRDLPRRLRRNFVGLGRKIVYLLDSLAVRLANPESITTVLQWAIPWQSTYQRENEIGYNLITHWMGVLDDSGAT